jgi:hypothetical protein
MRIEPFCSLLLAAAMGFGRPRRFHLSEEKSNVLGLSAEIQVEFAF